MNDFYKISYVIYIFIFLFIKNTCFSQDNTEDPYQLVIPQENETRSEDVLNSNEFNDNPNTSNFAITDNEIVKIYMRTMNHWKIDFTKLEENRAGAACINWDRLESIKQTNGLFLSLGYSKNMATEESAINSALSGCERMRVKNNEEDVCDCESVIINNKALINYPNNNIAIEAQVAESLIDTNKLEQDANTDQSYEIENNIQINDLPEKSDYSWLGLLSREEGGLGWLMWEGTNLSVAKTLLNFMPTKARSPYMNSLMRRVLLSRAKRPVFKKTDELEAIDLDGNPVDTANIEIDDFLLIRLKLLSSLGEYKLLNELIELIPKDIKDDSFYEKITLILLETGDVVNGCLGVRKRLSEDSQSLNYRKLLVACQIAEGELDAALLSLQLIEQDTNQEDPFFNMILPFTEEEGSIDSIEGFESPMLVTLSAGPYGKKLSNLLGSLLINSSAAANLHAFSISFWVASGLA